ncbi:hypothetical protein SAMN04488241_10242 [Sphingomonas rubra]|uniref:Uncharacterized protein n=1 Tax=Sphingomonas rubra TaxID=634430 RepID=A0A1I5QH60_9SPHN|nr:hypothetical protein SAMN04488241_10242 [Sphingomonas rubra]
MAFSSQWFKLSKNGDCTFVQGHSMISSHLHQMRGSLPEALLKIDV